MWCRNYLAFQGKSPLMCATCKEQSFVTWVWDFERIINQIFIIAIPEYSLKIFQHKIFLWYLPLDFCASVSQSDMEVEGKSCPSLNWVWWAAGDGEFCPARHSLWSLYKSDNPDLLHPNALLCTTISLPSDMLDGEKLAYQSWLPNFKGWKLWGAFFLDPEKRVHQFRAIHLDFQAPPWSRG